jgi:oligoendopeptidase F
MSHPHYEPTAWSLADLYPAHDSAEVQQAIADLEQRVEQFATQRSLLTPTVSDDQFLQMLQAIETIVGLLSQLSGYAGLAFSADTQNQQNQIFMAQMQQKGAQIHNQILFFELWWKQLGDEPAQRLLAVAGDNRYWLETLRLEKPHTLTEPEEKIINLKNVNGRRALMTLYESITNRYTFNMSVNGESRELTRGELQVYFRNADPELRAAAYREFFRVYSGDATILGQIYQYMVRDWRSENVDLRAYSDPLAVRNLLNDVPDEVVQTLLAVCRQNAPLFHRYFRLKAQALGLEKLRRYDIYAPISASEPSYPFAEGVRLTLESLHRFDPQVATLAQKILDENHLDSEVRKGKRSGAFCATLAPELTPWVLQSYQGRTDDVTTLAHEIGHGIHALLAADHTILTQHASLPLAETASTFSEMLLVDRLLEIDPNPAVRRDLLFGQMDSAYATIMRQAFFAIFEQEAHALIHDGGSVETVSALYLNNLREQFGDSLELSDDFQHEWVAIPHFYNSPFYVYAYSFGQLLVLSLYRQFKQEGDAFKPRYLAILAAGGSDSPENILWRAGIDIRATAFWQGGFDVLAEMLAELEATSAAPA